jgi:AraC-like DNA-binding protein
VKFGVVVAGTCFIQAEGGAAKRLSAGDVFLLGRPPPFRIASDLTASSRSALPSLRSSGNRLIQIGSTRTKQITHLIGGRFGLDDANAHLLVEALPRLVCIPAAEAGALRGVTQLLTDEVRSARTGRSRVLDQLAQLVLAYSLRWLDADGQSPARRGWLRALADPRIATALGHIHANVETGTSLTELARIAGMSRTAFAARFKALVGQPPLTYAIQWRMSLAKDALRTTDRAIGALAFELGYESESAFSMAFRREVGTSPREFRRAR